MLLQLLKEYLDCSTLSTEVAVVKCGPLAPKTCVNDSTYYVSFRHFPGETRRKGHPHFVPRSVHVAFYIAVAQSFHKATAKFPQS